MIEDKEYPDGITNELLVEAQSLGIDLSKPLIFKGSGIPCSIVGMRLPYMRPTDVIVEWLEGGKDQKCYIYALSTFINVFPISFKFGDIFLVKTKKYKKLQLILALKPIQNDKMILVDVHRKFGTTISDFLQDYTNNPKDFNYVGNLFENFGILKTNIE